MFSISSSGSSSSSSLSHAGSPRAAFDPLAALPGAARGYARSTRRAPPPPRRDGATMDGGRGGNGGGSGGSSGSGSGRGGGLEESSGPMELGRVRGNCLPLFALPSSLESLAALDAEDGDAVDSGAALEAPAFPGAREPSQRSLGPDGATGDDADDLQLALMFRRQLEDSQLPAELKRAAFDQPWAELLVDARRTLTVTAKGKLETLRATVAVGNMDGLCGVGSAAGGDMQRALLNALLAAYRAVAPVPLYRGHTIFHPVDVAHKKVRRFGVW